MYETLFNRGTHVALVCGEIAGGQNVLTYVHSTCLTGDLFRSVRCDCGTQLDTALRRISDEGRGVLLYLNQAARGSVGVQILRDLGVRSTRQLSNDAQVFSGVDKLGHLRPGVQWCSRPDSAV